MAFAELLGELDLELTAEEMLIASEDGNEIPAHVRFKKDIGNGSRRY